MTPTTRIAPGNLELYRLLTRTTGMSQRRPDPPREVKYANGALKWSQPQDTSNITHYAIRIDRDGESAAMVVPVGTRWTPIPGGTKAFVSSLNVISGLESSQVAVDISSGGGIREFILTLPEGTDTTTIEFADGSSQTLLVVEIKNNTTGEGKIEWGANVRAGTPTNISEYPNSLNRFLLWWRKADAEWALTGLWLEP